MKLTKCPKCNCIWEHEAGTLDLKQKDDTGKILTPYFLVELALIIARPQNTLPNLEPDVPKTIVTAFSVRHAIWILITLDLLARSTKLFNLPENAVSARRKSMEKEFRKFQPLEMCVKSLNA